MSKQEQVQFSMSPDEYRILVDVLNEERNERIEDSEPTDDIDSLLQKAAESPVKKVRVKNGGEYR